MLETGRFRVSYSYEVRPGQRASCYHSIPECTSEQRIQMYDKLHKLMKKKNFKFHPIG